MLLIVAVMWPKEPPTTREMLPRDLCNYTHKTKKTGYQVKTLLDLPITPTSDPKVWIYHPGRPESLVPATIKFEFREPPTGARLVMGTVARIEFDLEVRSSWHHGIVVISEAVEVP